MEHLEQAQLLYRKRYDYQSVLSSEDQASLSNSIAKMIRTCFMQNGGTASFRYPVFISVIRTTVDKGRFDDDKTATAFQTLEKYLHLLLSQPWKREFWLLKMYGGFFCTRVKAYLENPEQILTLVGYCKENGSDCSCRLVLNRPPDPELLISVAFDCQVASVGCNYIVEYHKKMKCMDLSLADAMNVLLSNSIGETVPSGILPLTHTNTLSALSKTLTSKETLTPMISTLDRKGLGVGSVSYSSQKAVPTVGGMGMDLVYGIHAPPSVIGTLGTHTIASRPHVQYYGQISPIPPPTYSEFSDVKDVLFRGSEIAGDIVSRPPSYASTAPSTRFSSGYGSSSVYGATPSSSTYGAASSGYGSGAQSATSAFNSAGHRTRDSVDYGTRSVSQTFNQRHARPLPLPQQKLGAFPYIDEDKTEEMAAPFPEATHDEHVLESIRNVQNSNIDSGILPTNLSSPALCERKLSNSKEKVPVSFDDWKWLRERQGIDGRHTFAGSSIYTKANQGDQGLKRMPFLSDGGVRHSQQPATAVTAMLTQERSKSVSSINSNTIHRILPPYDAHHHSPGSWNYIGDSTSANSKPTLGPTPPEFELGASKIPPGYLNSGAAAGSESGNNLSRVPVGSYTSPMMNINGQQQPRQQAPSFTQQRGDTFTQRVEEVPLALLARQPSGSSHMLNNLDKVNKASNTQGFKPGSNSSSAVILREKLGEVSSGLRTSSLASPKSQAILPLASDDVAGIRRIVSHTVESAPLAKWKCHACTMENNSINNICTACSKSRDAPDLQFPTVGESKRACPTCTLENPSGFSICEACGGQLPQDIHTYV